MKVSGPAGGWSGHSMIEEIVVARRDVDGVNLELHGDLARILTACSQNAKTPSRGETGALSLVAG